MKSHDDERKRCMAISQERGDFVMGDDGYFCYWPDGDRNGSLAAHHLRWLADELDRLNKKWDDDVQGYFNHPDRH